MRRIDRRDASDRGWGGVMGERPGYLPLTQTVLTSLMFPETTRLPSTEARCTCAPCMLPDTHYTLPCCSTLFLFTASSDRLLCVTVPYSWRRVGEAGGGGRKRR